MQLAVQEPVHETPSEQMLSNTANPSLNPSRRSAVLFSLHGSGAVCDGWQIQARNRLGQSRLGTRGRLGLRTRTDVRGTIFRCVEQGNNGESESGPK